MYLKRDYAPHAHRRYYQSARQILPGIVFPKRDGTGVYCIELFIRYLVSTIEREEEKELTDIVKKSIKNGGAVIPSIAEKWLQEGIEKGIEKNQIEIVEKMILNGMENDDIRKITGLSMEKIDRNRKRLKKSWPRRGKCGWQFCFVKYVIPSRVSAGKICRSHRHFQPDIET